MPSTPPLLSAKRVAENIAAVRQRRSDALRGKGATLAQPVAGQVWPLKPRRFEPFDLFFNVSPELP